MSEVYLTGKEIDEIEKLNELSLSEFISNLDEAKKMLVVKQYQKNRALRQFQFVAHEREKFLERSDYNSNEEYLTEKEIDDINNLDIKSLNEYLSGYSDHKKYLIVKQYHLERNIRMWQDYMNK